MIGRTCSRWVQRLYGSTGLSSSGQLTHFQCAIPAFAKLLPESDNEQLLDLLFIFSSWHALAKLRLHTDETLNILDEATSALGTQLRRFRDTVCVNYNTRELAKEANARRKRELLKTTSSLGVNTRKVSAMNAIKSTATLHTVTKTQAEPVLVSCLDHQVY
jgi:hypothetical protein